MSFEFESVKDIVYIVGAFVGAFYGVKLSVVKLQTQMDHVLKEIASLRESRHDHAGFIQEHEGRLTSLERKKR